ncbi:MAG: NADH-quinone oxidoreductase subunit J [Gammaproteobacteria bacterium]|jgi:NADH-quinone oxidoreductase subunit J
MISLYIFYFFAAILVLASSMVITVRNPVHAALFLVLAFFSSAAIWLILEAEFLAIVLILVYVGAVMVLFLFVVMMLDINLTPLREGFARFLPVGIIIALLMVVSMGLVLKNGYFDAVHLDVINRPVPESSNTLELGKVLFTEFIYPFEIAGAILLVAIVAAISLTLRKGRSKKTQNPDDQVRVKREDRLRIVKMKTEKKDG